MRKLLFSTILLFLFSNLLFAGRYYDAAVGRFLQVDPQANKFPAQTPYNYSLNNPLAFVDPNGEYAISVHYKVTYEALQLMGVNSAMADNMAHMASVYADNPGSFIRFFESVRSGISMYHRDGVNYSGTVNSQNDDLGNVVRHSMRSSAMPDNRTGAQAMLDGMKFGWDHIFAAANSEVSSDMNSAYMRNFGVGVHALQDAFAHQGATMKQHVGLSSTSLAMISYDMQGPSYNAMQITKSAVLVIQILQGNFSNVVPGMTLNLTGMSSEQQQQVMQRLKDEGWILNVQD